MYILGVKKVQICPFKGTAPATSCITPKFTILNPYFSVCVRVTLPSCGTLYIETEAPEL